MSNAGVNRGRVVRRTVAPGPTFRLDVVDSGMCGYREHITNHCTYHKPSPHHSNHISFVDTRWSLFESTGPEGSSVVVGSVVNGSKHADIADSGYGRYPQSAEKKEKARKYPTGCRGEEEPYKPA